MWVAHFVISALTGKKLNIFGNGKQVRDILFIDDLTELFSKYISFITSDDYNLQDQDRSMVFNIGGGINN